MLTVAALIEYLQKQPQDLLVIYDRYSEHCLLEKGDVYMYSACEPRNDGWVPRERPDKPTQLYLKFPGN